MDKQLLYFHIAAGAVALLTAPLAMATKKGGKWHARWGKTYFWAMTFVASSAVVLAAFIHFNLFLLLVAVFSYYFVGQGYRAVFRKRPSVDNIPFVDKLLPGALALGSLGCGAYGAFLMAQGNWAYGGLMAGFGVVGFMNAKRDWKLLFKPSEDRKAWLYAHMQHMLGGYIATVTAFSVNTFHFLPGVLPWIWPALIGVPLSSYWVKKYKQKGSSKSPGQQIAILQPEWKEEVLAD